MSFPWINDVLTKTDRKIVTAKTDRFRPLPILKPRRTTTALPSYSNRNRIAVFPSSDEQEVKNPHPLNKDVLQKGLTIMQLAISEPQNRTSLALYTIALNKFVSAGPAESPDQKDQLWSSLTKSEQHPTSFHNNNQFDDKTIVSQLLLVLLNLSTLIMMIIHKTPLPGAISNAVLLFYQYVVYLDKKFQLVHFVCQQIGYFLYWLIDISQHYDLPQFGAQIVYVIKMTILHTGKTCMETE